MSKPTGTDEVQEEEMFGRITNRIDALIKGNANFEQLKEHIHTALEVDTELDGWLASETMVARVAAAHQLAKRYEPALETITRQEETLSIIAETVVTLGEDVSWERKRADDLQAEKDLIAEKLGLIEEEPEPEPPVEPPETADDLPVAHASDGMDHDDDAAANADPAPDDEGAGE